MSMRQAYDTAANWTSVNPVLEAGEIGVESDKEGIKVGDGSTAWVDLAYIKPPLTDEFVFLGVEDFYSGNYGSPTVGIVAGAAPPFDTMKVAQINDAEGVGWVGVLPHYWKRYGLYYYWSNSGTGSGNVEWQCYWSDIAAGEVVRHGSADQGVIVTVDAPTVATELVISQIGTNLSRGVNVATPRLVRCMFNRHTTSTLVGDAYLYGVEFRREL